MVQLLLEDAIGALNEFLFSLFQNVSEDTDDMYDDLFKKYGKVVLTRSDKKPPSAEVDDDAESLACMLASS